MARSGVLLTADHPTRAVPQALQEGLKARDPQALEASIHPHLLSHLRANAVRIGEGLEQLSARRLASAEELAVDIALRLVIVFRVSSGGCRS